MPVARHRERELTFDVDADWSVPDLAPLVPKGGQVATATHTLDATYYDTADSTLRTLGFTLRRRSGGDDAGWHLKIPAGDARTEVHSQSAGRTVPAALSRRVAGVVGDGPVRPVATIRTTRHTSQVLDAEGELVLEVADDEVVGTREPDAGEVTWREVEVELGPAGTEKDLHRIRKLFVGARTALVARKINHILGDPDEPEVKGVPGLVAAYVRVQCRAVLLGDVRLRDDPDPEAVHTTRIALRRLRSTLRTFPDAVADVPDGFDADLKWLAGLLSPIRDGDILERRLAREVERLDPEDVVGPVPAEISRALRDQRRTHLRALDDARSDPRYRSVLGTLVGWYAGVPVRKKPTLRPQKTLKRLRRKVARRIDKASDAHGLHQARKAAKRLRYAGDVLAPKVDGAKKQAKAAKRMQTRLGDHQDLVVAIAFVRLLARSEHVANGFTYGVLTASMEADAAAMRRAELRRGKRSPGG